MTVYKETPWGTFNKIVESEGRQNNKHLNILYMMTVLYYHKFEKLTEMIFSDSFD